jgi:hypothetical protein
MPFPLTGSANTVKQYTWTQKQVTGSSPPFLPHLRPNLTERCLVDFITLATHACDLAFSEVRLPSKLKFSCLGKTVISHQPSACCFLARSKTEPGQTEPAGTYWGTEWHDWLAF